jgi:hypothetical protein
MIARESKVSEETIRSVMIINAVQYPQNIFRVHVWVYTIREAIRSHAIVSSNISQLTNPMNEPVPMLSDNALTSAINGIYDVHVSPLLIYFSSAWHFTQAMGDLTIS